MPGHGRKQIDDAVLLALACGATVEMAAQNARVSARTVYRRLQDPALRQRLQTLRAEMVQRTSAMLTAAGMEAVKALLGMLQGPSPDPVRLGAARTVLGIGCKLREDIDMVERLTALENQLAALLAEDGATDSAGA